MSNQEGILYIVATPIGNLGDFTPRAIEVLQAVDVIAAEDTRHSRPLLQRHGINTRVMALHAHNEHEKSQNLLNTIAEGRSVALISDAGTPLISDPGYILVQQAHAQGLKVSPVPGACALIAALSVAGLPTDKFVFEGFLPAKSAARIAALQALKAETRTLVFYESSHRIVKSLADILSVLGAHRNIVIAREITKQFETIHKTTLGDVGAWITHNPQQQKGEFVLMIAGVESQPAPSEQSLDQTLAILLEELPVKVAAGLAARLTGCKRNEAYQRALALKAETQAGD